RRPRLARRRCADTARRAVAQGPPGVHRDTGRQRAVAGGRLAARDRAAVRAPRRALGDLRRPDRGPARTAAALPRRNVRCAPLRARRAARPPRRTLPGARDAVTSMPPRLLLGSGPSPVPQRVLDALATPTVGHLDPAFGALMDETADLLRAVFQTS